jgi:hypothetical protein
MEQFWNLNLIHFFDFYLALIFVLGTWTRIRQYRAVLGLVRAVPGRWPKLFQLAREHWAIFLTWQTVGPALVTLVLILVQTIASRLIWPEAGRPPRGLTVARLAEHPWAVPCVALFGLGMLAMDLYGVVVVGEVDRHEMERYFDQAEYWLKSWAAPVVHFFTLGRINPRGLVATEVRSALEQASQLLNFTLWWISAQLGLRIAFGLSLWLTYAWSLE